MRKRLVAGIAFIAVVFAILLALHGSTWRQMGSASAHIAAANRAAAENQWPQAAEEYAQADAAWPPSMRNTAQYYLLRIATQHARVRSGQIDDAMEKLNQLSTEIRSVPGIDPQVEIESRRELAMTAYYKAWLSRRQGLPDKVWEPLLRSARQDFEYMAQTTAASSDKFSDAMRHNAEETRRLERLSNETVYADPLPEAALASNLRLAIDRATKVDPNTPPIQSDGRMRMGFELKPSGGGGATKSKFKGS